MRDAFVRALTGLAAADPNVILITGDLGFGVLTNFAKQFPRQYFNAGIAEQNMTSLAVGLALEGKCVFTYSIANFPTLRCLEQIRNDACYHSADVKIVSVGGGLAYGPLGVSHHATEDLAIMRSLPGMTVLAPGDPAETERATRLVYETKGTCYLRLGRGGEKTVHTQTLAYNIGEGLAIHRGGDVVLLSTGGILAVAAAARELLLAKGVSTALYSIPSIKPFPSSLISELALTRKLLVTIEEHSITGGFGGAVSETIAGLSARHARVLRCGLGDQFSSVVGTQDFLRARYGLSAEAIAAQVLAAGI
jgi:transketolase